MQTQDPCDPHRLTDDHQLGDLGLHSPSITLCLTEILPCLVLPQVPQHQLAFVLVERGIQQCIVVVPVRMQRWSPSRSWEGRYT